MSNMLRPEFFRGDVGNEFYSSFFSAAKSVAFCSRYAALGRLSVPSTYRSLACLPGVIRPRLFIYGTHHAAKPHACNTVYALNH